MIIRSSRIHVHSEVRPTFIDVTRDVKGAVSEAGIQNGIVVVYSPHTTCSVFIQEDSLDTTFNGTRFIHQDLLDIFDRLVPVCTKEGQYLHPGPKCAEYSVNTIGEPLPYTLNTDGHLRSSMMGRSESIPVIDGKVQLGDHGCIYFADFDGTRERERTVLVQVMGE